MARAIGAKPRGERTRASVTWPRNGRFSGGKPNGSTARSQATASRPSSATPPCSPAQTTRGRVRPGNAPRPRHASGVAVAAVAAPASASRIPGSRSSGTWPRNLRVRCIPADETQRTSARGARVFNRAWTASSAALTSSDRSTATKQRTLWAAWATPRRSVAGLRARLVLGLAASLSQPAPDGGAHLALELAAEQHELCLLLHAEALLRLPEAVLRHRSELAIDGGGLGDQLLQRGLILVGTRQGRAQLLVDGLPLGDQLHATLVGLAED